MSQQKSYAIPRNELVEMISAAQRRDAWQMGVAFGLTMGIMQGIFSFTPFGTIWHVVISGLGWALAGLCFIKRQRHQHRITEARKRWGQENRI